MNDLEAEFWEANRKARRDLVALLRSGGALLFAGAGCAVPAGYPSLPGLLALLETMCMACGPGFIVDRVLSRTDPLAYADRIKAHIQSRKGSLDRYHAELLSIFKGPPQLGPFHDDLVALPFKGVITTNYDNTLETALIQRDARRADLQGGSSRVLNVDRELVLCHENPRRVHGFLSGLTRNDATQGVVHLHGIYRSAESIVLSHADYVSAYGMGSTPSDPTQVQEFLGHVFATWALVFVGFSLSDPVLIAVLRASTDRHHLWGSPTHFAILDTTRETRASDHARAQDLKEKYGIVVLYFENDDGSFRNLYELIAGLRNELAPRALAQLSARMVSGMRE